MTDYLTAAWALRYPIAVGLAMLAAACIAHRRDDSHDRTLAEIRALPTKEHA